MNGSHRRSPTTCRPSILTTARTGPRCSTVTRSISPAKDTGSPWSGPDRTEPTRVTGPSTGRPDWLAARTSAGPVRPISQRRSPTSTSTASAVSVTFTPLAGAVARPRVTTRPAAARSAGTAWALHLIEPSGQVAVVQVCAGTAVPSASRTASAVLRFSAPRGQATPKVCPMCIAGAAPSIQRIGAGRNAGTGAASRRTGSSAVAPPSSAIFSVSRRVGVRLGMIVSINGA